MQFLKLVCIIFFSASLFGCMDKEMPIRPVPPGDLEIHSPGIGSDYGIQVYYSIAQNEVIASNLKTDWCFALEIKNDSVILSLNSSRYMRISPSIQDDFNTPLTESDVEDIDWQISSPTGVDQVDNPFFIESNTLYILDLGRNIAGEPIGYARLTFDNLTHWLEEFHVQIGDLDLSTSSTINVLLDPQGIRSHFSALEQSKKEIEPAPGSWELWLTQYTEVLDGNIQYLVSGILTPSPTVEVYQAPFSDWDVLLVSDWSSLAFNSDWNEIGYDWKSYDLSVGGYEVNQDVMYCIKTAEGREFLIHIIDFYDDDGQTGTFTFESIER